MGEDTKIEWAHHTFNPWIGCAHVEGHPGCDNCYAERQSKRAGVAWGEEADGGIRRLTSVAYWKAPLHWNQKAAERGVRERVLTSWADPFEDWQGPIVDRHGERLWLTRYGLISALDECPHGGRELTMAHLRYDWFTIMGMTRNLDWMLLTKRPENVRRMWPKWTLRGHDHPTEPRHLKNVWLGVSVSDEETADRLIPQLWDLRDLTPCLFVSFEPLLGPIDMGNIGLLQRTGPCFDWVIIGGESGKDARACHIDWIRSIRDQCLKANVPPFIKQLGAHVLGKEEDAFEFMSDTDDGWRAELKHPKGGDPEEWPEDMRVRKLPNT